MNKKLRQELGPALAAEFRKASKQAQADIRGQIAEAIADVLATHSQQLLDTLKERHGDVGLTKALPFVHEWAVHQAKQVLQDREVLVSDVQHIVQGTRPPTTTAAQQAQQQQVATRHATAATLQDVVHYLRQRGDLRRAQRVGRVAKLLTRL
jgi:hypothetical protein